MTDAAGYCAGSRWGSRMNRWQRSTLAILVLFAVFLGACTPASVVSNVEFQAARYSGGPATGFVIEDGDLSIVGNATRVNAEVQGNEVFALAGVASTEAIVMRSALSDSRYAIFFNDGLNHPRGTPMSEVIDGLCAYLEEPPTHCS